MIQLRFRTLQNFNSTERNYKSQIRSFSKLGDHRPNPKLDGTASEIPAPAVLRRGSERDCVELPGLTESGLMASCLIAPGLTGRESMEPESMGPESMEPGLTGPEPDLTRLDLMQPDLMQLDLMRPGLTGFVPEPSDSHPRQLLVGFGPSWPPVPGCRGTVRESARAATRSFCLARRSAGSSVRRRSETTRPARAEGCAFSGLREPPE